METVLSIRGAVKRFGNTLALDNVDFELEQGELLALLGPNGAGKTTLVRAVAGRVRLNSGSIRLLGKDISRVGERTAARGRLGVVPQETALYPSLTAKENLRCFGELVGLNREQIRDRSDWVLEWTGLSDRADEPTHGYSGGMKRRLNIACSVLHRPDVLLLDEPTVGVDPQSRQRIWMMLSQLREDGISMVLTTHQLDEAQNVADRITIIDHGRAVANGTFDELARRTIGLRRRVLVSVANGEFDAHCESEFQWERGKIVQHVDDVANELPELLHSIQDTGGMIEDVRIESPTLQAIFIHLTGTELRD